MRVNGNKIEFLGFHPEKVKVARVLGAHYDGKSKAWVINDPSVLEWVGKFDSVPDGSRFRAIREAISASIDESMTSIDTPMDLPVPPGMRLKHHQYSGCRWIVKHPSTLQADSMGAGKTIMAAVSARKLGYRKILVICPASVKVNWRREMRKWYHDPSLTIGICYSDYFPQTDVVIINFELLERHKTKYNKDGVLVQKGMLDEREWEAIIVDECHKIKSPRRQRTRAILGEKYRNKVIQPPLDAKLKMAMSGTPIVNRPAEVWPVAKWLWPKSFPQFHPFAMRYCGAKRGKYGWDTTGSSNEQELNSRLRFLGMIARPKSITHAEVPGKSRRIIEFDSRGMKRVLDQESEAFRQEFADLQDDQLRAEAAASLGVEGQWRSAMKDLRNRVMQPIGELTRVRQEAALAKLPKVIEHIHKELSDRPDEKLVLFCWHKDVAHQLHQEFPSVMITGDVSADDRQRAIDQFQDGDAKVFVGTIASCGAGINLTAASRVFFVELHWVPGDMLQAEDRVHRLGQTSECEITYLVAEGSIDAVMAERIIDKIEIIEQCTGPIQRMMQGVPVTYSEDEAAVVLMGRDELEALAQTMEMPEPKTVSEGLAMIASGRVRKIPRRDQIACGLLSNLHQNRKLTPHQENVVKVLLFRCGITMKGESK
jgi:SWI/SNF-related matrix-associated actin-dependent regulator of chromatin subfamily A-like protein 1